MFLNNITAMYKDNSGAELDKGDLVQTIIIVAVFAVIAITVVGLIGSAIMKKGTDLSECIEGSTYTAGGAVPEECK